MIRRAAIGLAAMLVLGACVSTTQEPDGKSDSEAARYNAELGANYLRQGRLELAMEKLLKAVDQDPDLAAARTTLAILYEQVGDTTKAREQYRAAVRLEPKNAVGLNNYGSFLCRRGQREEGISFFERAAKDPFYQTPEAALTNAGVCARRIPDLEKAEAFMRQALGRDPRYPAALINLADLSYEIGKGLSARAFLQRYHQVASENPDTLWLAVQIERSLGDLEAAEEFAARLRRDYPESQQARMLEGDNNAG